MNLIQPYYLPVNRFRQKKNRGNCCQRCQERDEYLMVFDLPDERCIWVCPACHYDLSRANKLESPKNARV